MFKYSNQKQVHARIVYYKSLLPPSQDLKDNLANNILLRGKDKAFLGKIPSEMLISFGCFALDNCEK
jgi:hypothetical protein